MPASSPRRSTATPTISTARRRPSSSEAYRHGSPDNLTVQIVRIDELPDGERERGVRQQPSCRCRRCSKPRKMFDGYRIVRELHGSSRSHIYLAVDSETDATGRPQDSVDRPARRSGLSEALHDGGVGRAPHQQPARAEAAARRHAKRNYLYVVTEFIDGQTLTQWMIDNPKPDLETVRGIVEQIAKGLRAFHRMEMLHQDLRPDNIMIDKTGTVKIIDFGATGSPASPRPRRPADRDDILGTAQYTAPEYFLGEQRLAALRHVLAGRHRLSDADRPAALWRRRSPTRAHALAVSRLTYRPALARQPRDSGLDRRRAEQAVHPESAQALRQPVRVPVRSAPSQRQLSDDTVRRR